MAADSLFDIAYKKLTVFQKEILWEAFAKENGSLAVAMGTGKTIISLTLALLLRNNIKDAGSTPMLIIAAKSIIPEWLSQIKKFFGSALKHTVMHNDYNKVSKLDVSDFDFVITTPEFLAGQYKASNIRETFIREERPRFGPMIVYYNRPDNPYTQSKVGGEQIYSTKWAVMLVDESQGYYNIKSGRCQAIASISANHRWMLSGTMMPEPRPHKVLGYYLLMNHKDMPRNLPEMDRMLKSIKFKGMAETMVIRKENKDIKVNFNFNTEIISHTLSVEEGKIYMCIKDIIKDINNKLLKYKTANDTTNVKKMSNYMLSMITYLRQGLVCPLLAITTVAVNVSDYECKSSIARHFMDNIKKLDVDKWLDDVESLRSTRIKEAITRLDKHKNETVIIFSCFRTVLDVVRYFVEGTREVITITGNDKIDKRNERLEKFRNSNNAVLLLTYQICANGLNLQCSNTVLVLDFWFNADVTNQAIARVVRRGQKSKNINIYYFTSNTGIENSLFRVQISKKNLADELLSGAGKTKIVKMGAKQLAKMVEMDDNIKVLDEILK
jgi:SNF2 family DNA or RNA helicase